MNERSQIKACVVKMQIHNTAHSFKSIATPKGRHGLRRFVKNCGRLIPESSSKSVLKSVEVFDASIRPHGRQPE
jgi:hypothetical protein